MFKLKRVYDEPDEQDGFRVLVDRLWPRGVTKERAAIDVWMKDVAPSSELRKWVHADPERWDAFSLRYEKELSNAEQAVAVLRERSAQGDVTLVYGAKDPERNHARVLKHFLEQGKSGA